MRLDTDTMSKRRGHRLPIGRVGVAVKGAVKTGRS